jgi:zinc transport system permease protein
MLEIFQYGFMHRALVAGLAIGIIAPLIGTFLVTRKLSLMADTMSHIALSGVALGMLLQIEPMLVTLIVTIGAAILIEYLRERNKMPGEAILAMFLPGGLAVSVILLTLAKGVNVNILSYLFGSVTTVTGMEVVLTVILAAVVVAIVAGFYKQLLFAAVSSSSIFY